LGCTAKEIAVAESRVSELGKKKKTEKRGKEKSRVI